MLSIITQTLRLVARRWPPLLAWFLAGWLARYLLIELAAFVGSSFLLGGLLIMPLAILARLVSFVAMFLVLRDDMPSFRRLAPSPLPQTGTQRRRAFADAVLVSILPFFAFYAAWGLFNADMRQYSRRAIDSYFASPDVFDADRISYAEIDQLGIDTLSIAIIVIAFTGRWALKRYKDRVPRWMSLVGVYLETVWVFMTVYLIGGLWGQVTGWVNSRAAMAWLGDAREWLGQFARPLAFIWDGVQWALGEVGGVVLQPLAWLAIAGVIYGRALTTRRIDVSRLEALRAQRLQRARTTYASLPARARRRLGDVGQQATGRFRPIGQAFVTIWHAGAIPMGIFVLAYTVVISLQGWLRWALLTAIGPHDLSTFWLVVDPLIILVVVMIVEPLRVALVAAAFDHALATEAATAAERSAEADLALRSSP